MSGVAAVEEAVPFGPSAEEEAAMLAAEGESGPETGAPIRAAGMDEAAESAPLPPMEDLIGRIPASAREMIEELFRARFVTVKRMPKAILKGH